MKGILFLTASIFLLCSAPNASAQPNLETLYKNHQFFILRDEMKKTAGDASPQTLFYRGAVAGKFNRPLDSIALLEEFLKTTTESTDAKLTVEAYRLLADDYINLYQYARAAAASKTLLDEFKTQLDADKLEEAENNYKLFGAIADVPPQTISFEGDTRILATRDAANLLNVPVEINAQKINFVFDTGANISTITVSTAKRMNLKIVEADFDVGTSTDKRVKSKLAVAPALKIGNVTIHNPVFLVFEDAALAFPEANYQINGVIGFPVIEAMRQITITKSDVMMIPAQTVKRQTAQNVFLEGLLPVIEANCNNRRMIFELDTGAVTSTLNTPFYESQKAQILKTYKPQKLGVGGAGGIKRVDSYKLKNVSLLIAGKTARFPRIDLLPEVINEEKRWLYGTLGQDLIKQFARMTLDFEAMSLVFE